MNDDTELLRKYCENHSDVAFTELVRRHLNLVYYSAVRRTNGDPHLAEDITQQVFTHLARNANALRRDTVLPVWLFVATRHAAANAMRTERRREIRELKAHMTQEIASPPDPEIDWTRARPELDGVIDELDERDRTAVILRFFENRPFAEIGATLHLSEDAARMRVQRALDQLRLALGRRGITSTSAALAALLAEQAALAAPAEMAATVASQALAGGAAAVTVGVLQFAAMTKITTAFATLVALIGFLGVGSAAYAVHRNLNVEALLTTRRANSDQQSVDADVRLAALEQRASKLESDLATASRSVAGPKQAAQGGQLPIRTVASQQGNGSIRQLYVPEQRVVLSNIAQTLQIGVEDRSALQKAFNVMQDRFAVLQAERAKILKSNEVELTISIAAFPAETLAVQQQLLDAITGSVSEQTLQLIRSSLVQIVATIGGGATESEIVISRRTGMINTATGAGPDALYPPGKFNVSITIPNLPFEPETTVFYGDSEAFVLNRFGYLLNALHVSLPAAP